MEEVFLRFSHLSNEMFISLDNESISKCREVSKVWKKYLDNQRFYEIRKIKAIVGKFHKIGEAWEIVFNTASKATIMDLGRAVTQFYVTGTNLKYYGGLTPLHVSAGTGQLEWLKKLSEKTDDNNPKDCEGKTPFEYAAQNGHFDLCAYFVETLDDKLCRICFSQSLFETKLF